MVAGARADVSLASAQCSMDNEKRTKFLELVTANPRLPPGGLPQVYVLHAAVLARPGRAQAPHASVAPCCARGSCRLGGSYTPSRHCLGLPVPARGFAACMPCSMPAAPAVCALCFYPPAQK